MTRSTQRSIAIVGAGFSGTMTAVHLLRHAGDVSLQIALFERTGQFGRGVAYGTASELPILNVPAGRMSAFADDEDHFLRYLRESDSTAIGGAFVQRRRFGDYLQRVLDDAIREAERQARGTTLTRVTASVDAIALPDDHGRVTLTCGDGRAYSADRVILATGNYAPSDLPADGASSFYASGHYVRDPWLPGVLNRIPPDAPVLLLGTGLTMVDVVMELARHRRSAPIHAISRRGLVPLSHRPHGVPPSYAHLPPELIACEASVAAYLRAIRRHARRLEHEGIDWREVMASLRPVTSRLWETLSPLERRRFLRHARPYWDAHRHRIAPELFDAFTEMRRVGSLRLSAGRILGYAVDNSGVQVSVQPRGSRVAHVLSVATVINCTGPTSEVRGLPESLLTSLLGQSMATADELGLGLVVGEDGRLSAPAAPSQNHLWFVGPFLKARYWEATAVPELRVHAARTARRVLGSLRTS